MINYEKKLEQFKNLSLLKQSIITVAVIGAAITLLGNYSNIKKGVENLIKKYKENENVKEFVKDVSELIKPITNKLNSHLNDSKGE